MADLNPTNATVIPQDGSTRANGQAGVSVVQGDTLYLNAADNKLYKAVNTSDAAADVVGICLTLSTTDQPDIYLKSGKIDLDTTVVVGTAYVQSAAGLMTAITDVAHDTADWVTIIGIATTAAILDVNIQASGVQIPA